MTNKTPTQNRDLARLQTALTDLDALQRDLFTARTQAARAGIWNSFSSTLDEAYAAAWMHSIDGLTDKRTLWALHLELRGLHVKVWEVWNTFTIRDYQVAPFDIRTGTTAKITSDGYWLAFYNRVYGAYERVAAALFNGSDLTA